MMAQRSLADWLKAYEQYTENSEPPDLFKTWVGMSTIAAALRRKVWLEWDKPTYPNLYVVLVAPSGIARKGTAMGPAYELLSALGIPMAAEAITREALIKELEATGSLELQRSSMAAVTGGLPSAPIKIHSSLTIFSAELTVFLGYNNATLMADLCDWYDCKTTWTYRTKNSGSNEITGVWVNLIGATTPELLQVTLPRDAIGGGLTSRTIFVYEEKKSKLVELPIKTNAERALRKHLEHDLQCIEMLSGEFKITPEWVERWVQWYRFQDSHPPFSHPHFSGYISRRPTHMLKMCMILNASRTDDMIIDAVDFDAALDLLKRTEVRMPKAFGGVGMNAESPVMERIMASIGIEKEIDYSKLLALYLHDITAERFDAVILALEKIGFCRKVLDGTGKATIQLLEKGK